jgi:predicted membrane protein
MKGFAAKSLKQLKKFNVKSLLHNRVVLYVIVLLSILNVLFLANKKDYNSVMLFVIVGFLTSLFNKNMIVILLVALLATLAFKQMNQLMNKENMKNKKKEGLKNKNKKSEDDEDEDEDEEDVVDEENEDLKLDDNELDGMEDDSEKLKEKQETYDKLKDDFTEFQDIQKNILGNMKEIEPLLTKAEDFIEKFESYKKTNKY